MCQYVSVTRIDVVIVCDITRPQCLPAAPWHLTSVTPESEQSRGERDAGWQWQQGPGPDSYYYHSDYNYIIFTTFKYFYSYLLLTLTHKRRRMQGFGEIMCLTATLILLMGRMIGGDHLISDHNNVFSSISHVNFVSTLFLICQVFMVLVKLMWTWW